MEATHFDRLVESMTTSGTRRGLVRLVGVLPLSGVLGAFLAESSEAAKHRHRSTQRHRAERNHNDDQLQSERKKKLKKRCAHAGQRTSKKHKKCCAGLSKDAAGVCASATSASSAPPAGCVPGSCGGNRICVSGTCQPCDVCPSGCLFTSVAQAVAAAGAGATIRICPGLYVGDLTIDKSVTLIGAGDGNGADSTILKGSGTTWVVNIRSHVPTVALEHLRITGGATNEFGAGIRNIADRLTLTGCTVTGNKATGTSGDGGGIANFGTTVELINSRITGNTAGGEGGGILNWFRSTVTLDAASRITENLANLNNADSGGGIFNFDGTVTLSNTDNVSGNFPDNCGGTAMPLCVG